MLSSFYTIGKPLKLEKEAGTYIISMQSSSSAAVAAATHLILASPRSGTFAEFFTVT